MMRKIYYYYDAGVKSNDGRYTVDFYCTNGKKIVWAGQITDDSPTAALKFVRGLIDKLNKPKSFFKRIYQWWWFMTRK